MVCMPRDVLLVPRIRETEFFRRDPMAGPGDLLLWFCFLLTIDST